MTFQKELLHGCREFKTPELVGLGDGHSVEALDAGRVKIITELRQGKKIPGWMNDVLYVPKLSGNLFSVRAATQNWKVISFGHIVGSVTRKIGQLEQDQQLASCTSLTVKY